MKLIGEVTAERIMGSRTAIFAKSDFTPGMSFLVDFTEAPMASLETEDLRRVGAHGRRMAAGWGTHRTAVVTSRDLEFGLSRLYEVVGERLGLTSRVFRDYDAALGWLQEVEPGA